MLYWEKCKIGIILMLSYNSQNLRRGFKQTTNGSQGKTLASRQLAYMQYALRLSDVFLQKLTKLHKVITMH